MLVESPSESKVGECRWKSVDWLIERFAKGEMGKCGWQCVDKFLLLFGCLKVREHVESVPQKRGELYVEFHAKRELLKGVRQVGEMGSFDQEARRVPFKFERWCWLSRWIM